MKHLKKIHPAVYAEFGLIIALSLFWGWRLHYGASDIYSVSDESFYLSLPYRLIQGDCLFLDETNTAQMFAFLVYPILWVWLRLHNGITEGIMLSFRFLWLIAHLAVSAGIFGICARRKHWISGCVASCVYAASLPFLIAAFSYNTIALGCATLLAVVLYFDIRTSLSELLTGFLIAFIVLCNPYAIPLYLFVLFVLIRKQKKEKRPLPGMVIRTHAGIVLLLALFLLHLVRHASARGIGFSDFISIIRSLLANDNAHSYESILLFVQDKLAAVPVFLSQSYKLIALALAAAILLVLLRRKHKTLLFCLVAAAAAIISLYFSFVRMDHLILMFSMVIGFCLWVCNPPALHGKSGAFCFSLLFAICVHLASNNGILAIAWACVPGGVISWIAVEDFLSDESEDHRHPAFLEGFSLVCAAVIFMSVLNMDVRYVFHDERIPNLTSVCTDGPMAGIYTTAERWEKYTEAYSDIKGIKLQKDDRLLLYNTMPIDLLSFRREVCSPSTWSLRKSFAGYYCTPQSQRYYETHPDKLPNVLIVNRHSLWDGLSEEDYALIAAEGFTAESSGSCCQVFRR